MNDWDHDSFEAELRKLTPARPPADFMAKLAECSTSQQQVFQALTARSRRRAGLLPNWLGQVGRALRARRDPAESLATQSLSRNPAARTECWPYLRPQPRVGLTSWWRMLRWLGPAAAIGAAVVALVCWRWSGPPAERHAKPTIAPLAAAAKPALKADDVEIDQRLVSAFDAVARLPSGQSVRFRCREWSDALVLRDSASGIEIEQRTPRLEVVPVSFETY